MIFNDISIDVLRFVHTEIVSHLAQHLFFFPKIACQTKIFLSYGSKISADPAQQDAMQVKMKEVIIVVKGVNLSGTHCIVKMICI